MYRIPLFALSLFISTSSESVTQAANPRLSVTAGSTLRVAVDPSTRIAVPIIVDASQLPANGVGTVATNVTWSTTQLTFDSVRAGAFGTLTSSITSAASGSISVKATNGVGVTGTVTLATVYFTAAPANGSTPVLLSWPKVATTTSGSDLSGQFDARSVDVCVRGPSGKYGDTNGDTDINIIDAQQLARHSVGLAVANPTALAGAGDVTGDGNTNVVDAQQVARFSVGLSHPPRVNTPYYMAPAVASVVAPAPTGALSVGNTLRVTATPRDAGAASVAGCLPVTWTSMTPATAAVDSSGLVTGLASGTATIRATSGGQFTDITLSVAQNAPASDPVIVAAGDIVCGTQTAAANPCVHASVASLITSLEPTAVFLLGDNQYEEGSLADHNAYYDLSWGRFKYVTYPSAGNHEYSSVQANGYYDYFNGVGVQNGPAGERSKGYYDFRMGAWHVVVLNSNCSVIACGAGSAQEQWLRQTLAANASACRLAFWHHPLFSSGLHGDNPDMRALWAALEEHGTEVVLQAHDHDYERLAPQTSLGVASSAGIRSFVVGTGGKSLRPFDEITANSAVRNDQVFGVLKMTLRSTGYDWAFQPLGGGAPIDTGTGTCSPL